MTAAPMQFSGPNQPPQPPVPSQLSFRLHPSIPSRAIQNGADQLVALINKEKAPLLDEIQRQKTQITELRLAKGTQNDATSRLAAELEDTKRKFAELQAKYDAHVQATAISQGSRNEDALFQAQCELASRKWRSELQELDAKEAESKAERLQNANANIKNALQKHGIQMSYTEGPSGSVSLSFHENISRVMSDVLVEAKRRCILPPHLDASSLEASNLTLGEFAALVESVVRRSRASEVRLIESLRAGREKGWSIAQWMEHASRAGAAERQNRAFDNGAA
ncbi:hypothetical protein CC1G_03514 [Coprinopsis cinerea okayama7|uniref:Uncharacterized protein n=1 Tax=Coprinopsis cinerea (strain Okayama-7 / 130 / ATCC MYA-4618 / FGSC 9003) TaxID=240176 RepID=A8NCF6_COPC7|nr:hypothetical protein CC1G_03514 [Coprinopsis cinerea okayama7\|eukprot:XP_001832500.1 hypothetical protein CC1G_03514 [Coprinopsis cinerea okayama7\